MRIVHADAAILGDRDPILDAAIVLDNGSVVVDVGRASDVLPRHAGLRVERVQGVIAPGLVNAHTHLELSALRGHVPGGSGFVSWVEHLIGARVEVAPEDDLISIERGVAELDAHCTTAVGEITNSLMAVRSIAARGLVGCIFHEVFGVDRESLERRVADLPRIVEENVGTWPTHELEYAPTPHTLYTTHRSVAERLLRQARENGTRASLHLSEHASERRFLEMGDGPVADWYERRLKIRRDKFEWPKQSPIAFADSLGGLAPHVLCVHLTDARAEEIALVAERGAPVVLCPRSNLYIETRLPPVVTLRSAGILPALGTDSLASNASLDVLSEARALADRFSMVPARELVRMATWEGAKALGRQDVGRIAPGTRPGIFAVLGSPGDDPCAFLLAQVRAPRSWIARRSEGMPC